jgi:hypothetical protein
MKIGLNHRATRDFLLNPVSTVSIPIHMTAMHPLIRCCLMSPVLPGAFAARLRVRATIPLLIIMAGGLGASMLDAQNAEERIAPHPASTAPAYREGFVRGEADARSGLSRSPARWNGTVPAPARREFEMGYHAGYDRLAPQKPQAPQSNRYYQEGLTQGSRDALNGVPKDPSRYHGLIPREKRADFTRGYVEAYDRDAVKAGQVFYKQGMAQGARDARIGAPRDPSRHHAAVPREKRADFTRGYVDAYNIQAKARPPAPQIPQTYELLGMRYAQLDQKAGLRQDDGRHAADVPVVFQSAFKRSYRKAWQPQPR